jgi:CheY-like chemotaxis protein/HAMP domain-containing protein
LGHLPLIGKVSIVVGLLLLLFILSIIGTSVVLEREIQNRATSQHTSELVREVNQTTRALFQRQYELRQFLFATTAPNTKAYEAIDAQLDAHLRNIARLEADDPLQQSRLDRVNELNGVWKNTVAAPLLAAIQDLWRNNASFSLSDRDRVFQQITRSTTVQTSDIINVMDQVADSVRVDLDSRERALIQTEDLRHTLVYGSLVLALLFGAAAIFLSAALITRPLRHLSELMTRLAAHDHDIDIPAQSRRDEVGVIARALAEFKKMAIETYDQNWIKTGITTVSSRLQQAETLRDFAVNLVTEVAPLVNAGVGIFYAYDIDQNTLDLAGSYGFKNPGHLATSYRLGEGLVGQCGVERKPILVRDVPADYIRVHSGTGEAVPRHVILLPVVAKDRLMAVIEFGMFDPLTPRQHHLLEALGPLVALSLENIIRTVRTRELLEQTQTQANELRASEEELRTQQEELQASNEELRQQSDTLNQQKAILQTLQHDTQEKAEALTRANQYKSEFLANMSHELRTPLNSLLILSNDLAENGDGNLSGDQVESARIIHESGSNLLRLINDILDLSKIEAGKMELFLEAVDLKRFASVLKRNFNRLALEKQLDFNIVVDDGLPLSITGDGGKLEQVASNLLSNAFKFTRHGSVRVRIGRPMQDHPGFPAERSIAVEVSDTGIGIPPDKLAKVFGAFEQVDASTSRQFGGTGLGLAISRQLVKLHHGDMVLHSQLGEGSTFTILLPETQPGSQTGPTDDHASSEPAPAPRPRQVVAPASGQPPAVQLPDDRNKIAPGDITILVVEDDPAFARILIDLIQRKGYRALAATDGESGLALARQYRPTGILLDVMLPSMDGWTVIEHLKSDAQVRHIPVHFISALDESSRGRDLGAVGFLTKPVTADALAGAFERLLHFSADSKRRLLVVDDDSTARAAVRKLIESDMVEIFEAPTAEDALAQLNDAPFDCIVLDLGLPGMSGFDFLENISASHAGIPVVVYSARELSREESLRIRQHTDSIVIKGARSPERLIDEVSLFLHSINQPRTPSADTGDDLNGRKVLIVDDDMRNIFALSKVLRAKGLQVSLAQDGQKALKMLDENNDIEIVLMDVMMPVMDGYQTIQEIRKIPRFADLPIISLTAKAMKGDREKSLAAGANDYLSKPIDVAKLLSMMRVWLHR